jgi:hypothetical protein
MLLERGKRFLPQSFFSEDIVALAGDKEEGRWRWRWQNKDDDGDGNDRRGRGKKKTVVGGARCARTRNVTSSVHRRMIASRHLFLLHRWGDGDGDGGATWHHRGGWGWFIFIGRIGHDGMAPWDAKLL